MFSAWGDTNRIFLLHKKGPHGPPHASTLQSYPVPDITWSSQGAVVSSQHASIMPRRHFSNKGSLDYTKDGQMDFTYLLMMDYIYHALFVLYSIKRMQSIINTEELFERFWRVLEHLHFQERLFQTRTLQNVPSTCLWVTHPHPLHLVYKVRR